MNIFVRHVLMSTHLFVTKRYLYYATFQNDHDFLGEIIQYI